MTLVVSNHCTLLWMLIFAFASSQIIEDCNLPKIPSDKAASVTINLDSNPKERWKPVIEPYKKQILEFITHIESLLPEIVMEAAYEMVRNLGRAIPYFEEMEGIASVLKVPTATICAMNMFYELEKLCTSVLYRECAGTIVLARNMDMGALMGSSDGQWTIASLLRNITVSAEWVSSGKVIFTSSQFLGSVGVFTGARGALLTSINSRSGNEWFSGPAAVSNWASRVYENDTEIPAVCSFLLRQVLENESLSDVDVYQILTTRRLLVNVYFIVGFNNSVGVAIQRNQTGVHNLLTLENAGSSYLIQTNQDDKHSQSWYNDRYTPCETCINELVPCGSKLNKVIEGLKRVMSVQPVLNKATVYTTVMWGYPNGTVFSETLLQVCRDCYPF